MTAARLVIVVAYARNRTIGRDNTLPWKLSSDLKHFKDTTMSRPMIMGRKTFASIGRALPGRTSIVVTRDPTFAAEGVEVAHSLESAIVRGREIAGRDGADAVMITGGGEIYAAALPLADRIVATEVALDAEGTVCFPPLVAGEWIETSRRSAEQGPRDDSCYDIVIFDRVAPADR